MQPRLLRSPLSLGLALAAIILIAALGFRFYQQYQIDKNKEVITPLNLQPLTGPLVDRTRFEVSRMFGENSLSTTLPVSVTYQVVPLRQSYAIRGMPEYSQTDSDAHADIRAVPVNGGYIIKFENKDLCDDSQRCPLVLVARSDTEQLVQSVLFQIKAQRLLMSNVTHSGNPDLLVDYGNGPPERFVWHADDENPSYLRAPTP